MKAVFIFVIILSIGLCQPCPDGKRSMKVYMQVSTTNFVQESYALFSGGLQEYLSPAFTSGEQRTSDVCLTKQMNDQYEIELRDTGNDYWYFQSWMQIFGDNDNIIFKQWLHDPALDRYWFSMYSPINKNQADVHFSTTVQVGEAWIGLSFTPGADWSLQTLGSIASSHVGAQYFRKTFSSLPNLAAYEVGMNYQAGIVVYLNGNEIYRDNMPTGAVTGTTPAGSTYSSYAYRSVYRNGLHINGANSVIAVSLHFLDMASSNTVQYNMYLSQLASSQTCNKSTACYNCWIIPEVPTITTSSTTGVHPPARALNWVRNEYYADPGWPYTLIFTYTNKYEVNGFEYYPYQWDTYCSPSVETRGSPDTVSDFVQTYATTTATYADYVYNVVKFDPAGGVFQRMSVTVGKSPNTNTEVHELHYTVCNFQYTTSFTYEAISGYVNLDEFKAFPSATGVSSCSAPDGLPAGLSVDPVSCAIVGVAAEPANGSYQITAESPFTITGTISITIIPCSGQLLTIERTYGSLYYQYETIKVIDDATNAVVYEELANSGQAASTTRMIKRCTTAERIRVEMDSTSYAYWYANSYVTAYASLGDAQYEAVLRARYDDTLGLSPVQYFNIKQHIPGASIWKYQFPSGTPAAGWHETAATSWSTEAAKGSFPAATNQFQMYAKTFTVSDAELANAGGFSLSIRYRHGIFVYLNGVEAFRNNVSDSATGMENVNLAAHLYSTLMYRTITLPVMFMKENASDPEVRLIKSGQNTIAIGLVGMSAAPAATEFDAALRLFGDTASDRILDFVATNTGMTNAASTLFSKYYSNYNYYASCATNMVQLQFNNDRREWISSFTIMSYHATTAADYSDTPRSFKFQAKNEADTDWVELYEAKGEWKWWMKGQKKKAFVKNKKPYNMYRWVDISTNNPSSCTWRIGELFLHADKTDVTVPDLSYRKTVMEAYRDVEMAEEFPDQSEYAGFTIDPALPAGLYIDPPSGVIGGTPTEFATPKPYTVTGIKPDGSTSTFVVTFSVVVCHNGKSLITFVIRTESGYAASGWKMYEGREILESRLVSSMHGFSATALFYYADQCLDHKIYSARFYKEATYGWYTPGYWAVSLDQSGLRIDFGQVPAVTTAPSYADTTFSSYFPWQIEHTNDWQVLYRSLPTDDSWKMPEFAPSGDWETMALSTLEGKTDVTQTTAFIRHTFSITSLDEYPVMNVRARYNGGFVAYLNGKRFARFNLPDYVESSTEAFSFHEPSLYSKFHVILLTEGGRVGVNVVAFEHHRAEGASTSIVHAFDSTAALGVKSCNILADSVVNIEGIEGAGKWTPASGAFDNYFDQDLFQVAAYKNNEGVILQWEIENLDKSRWNSYFMMTGLAYTNYGFTVSARFTEAVEWTDIDVQRGVATPNRGKLEAPMSIGMAGFKHFRFRLDLAGSGTMALYELGWQYCKPTGGGNCQAADDFPAVGEGEWSPGECLEGFTGYSKRKCQGGVLGAVDYESCTYKPPEQLMYDLPQYVLVRDAVVTIPAPLYVNIIERFYQNSDDTPLPAGLSLDSITGAISGVPLYEQGLMLYTIRAENPAGTTKTEVWFSVRRGTCAASGVYKAVNVEETAVYMCSEGGSYIGEKSRSCKLGEKDGEWEAEKGSCVSVPLIVLGVVVGIILVIVIIMIVVRSNTKARSVGGVKRGTSGKKGSSGKKPSAKAGAGKAVKV